MKKILKYCWLLAALYLTSCSSWLDVKPLGEIEASELFKTQKGFQDALLGCYVELQNTNAYGQKLVMEDIECLGQIWVYEDASDMYNELKSFNYENVDVVNRMAVIYDQLYHIISQTNMIIDELPKPGDIITDRSVYAMVKGEAHAIRALCHFDVLRIWGQLPQGGTQKVRLPYAEKVAYNILPDYYSYDEFVDKIRTDLEIAAEALKDDDPIFLNTYEDLNSLAGRNIFGCFRQQRLNYWAVKALQARFYLYLGDSASKAEALKIARDIIAATGADGDPLMTLGGIDVTAIEPSVTTDIAQGYLASPSECLFMLNRYNFSQTSVSLFGSGVDQMNRKLSRPEDDIKELFALEGGTVNPATKEQQGNNRFVKIWKLNVPAPASNERWAIFHKYYYLEDNKEMTKNEVIPILRLSEMYLIVMELTADLAEANRLHSEYMFSHNVVVSDRFQTLDEVREWVYEEYIREFWGEGHAFFTYKRQSGGAVRMKFRDEPVIESNYIVPLPDTEYDHTIKE